MSTYEHEGLPLTPAVFADLVIRLGTPGQPISRNDLIKLVSEHHESHGGLSARGTLTTTAKKALQTLQASGMVTSTAAHGYWRIAAGVEETSLLEIGSGRQAVYVYYFPAYRDQAAYKGTLEWPMKIGMTTTGEVNPRIREQCGTAMPEEPVVGLIYRTDDAATAERLLHSTLTTRHKRRTGPGREWFMTSLQEIRDVLEYANGH